MNPIRARVVLGLLAGLLQLSSSPLWAAETGVVRQADDFSRYCHLKFPAITEDTLFTDHPVLKDPSLGDFVVLFAPCDYDPLGKEEVARQKRHVLIARDKHLHSD